MQTTLPGDRRVVTSRLGFGMATLMREGSARKRQYVFEAAYDHGFRHFDVAPLYGLGRAEPELGRLLKGIPAQVTVGTKFGLRPSAVAHLLGGVQRPLRWALDRSSPLRSMARRYTGSAVRPEEPVVEDVVASVEWSLRALGLERLDLLLMHDMPWDDHWAGLWAAVRESGTLVSVGAVGIASGVEGKLPHPSGVLTKANVLQSPASAFEQSWTSNFDTFRIEFGLLARELTAVSEYFEYNPEARRMTEGLVGRSLRQPQEVAAFLVSMNLAKYANSILIVGTTNAEHAEALWKNVECLILPTKSHNAEILEVMSEYLLGPGRSRAKAGLPHDPNFRSFRDQIQSSIGEKPDA